MLNKLPLLICTLLLLNACKHATQPNIDSLQSIQNIAFGSCNRQDLDQSYWPIIQAQNPDLWLWLGDNVYADTEDMNLMADIYQQQKTNPFYQNFSKTIPINGIWDDHDYGQNDGNKTFQFKHQAKTHFLDFIGIAEDDPVHDHHGIYRSETYGLPPRQVKIIYLDTRTFQDPLVKATKGANKNYETQPNGQILGAEQWQWLEQELNLSTANINIIANSIQIIPEDHRYEMWSNFPNQRKRLFDLLVSSQVNNPIMLSGDRHLSEISKIQWHGHELIDITASGLTHSFSGNNEYNRHRVGNLITTESFSTLNIDWDTEQIKVQQFNMQGDVLNNLLIELK
jgi:alkaline phosphatase D